MFNIRLKFYYLLHRLKANNRHGIHSPFVYRLIDDVIYDFHAKNAYPELEKLYSSQKSSCIVAPPLKVLQLLYRLITDAPPKTVMMAGTKKGMLAECVHLAASDADFYPLSSVELSQNVKSDLVLMEEVPAKDVLGLYNGCLPYVKESTVLIIQNVHQHQKNKQVWQQIKADERVTVTIDLFWLQLVYFRKGQAKEHFRIKY